MSTGPNMESVDRYLDGQDLAVEQDEDHDLMCSTAAMDYPRCRICGAQVPSRAMVGGVCYDCRALEGSVWTGEWR